MAYIEYVRNPIEEYEKNQLIEERERIGLPPFWEWELKLLQDEQQHYIDSQKKLAA